MRQVIVILVAVALCCTGAAAEESYRLDREPKAVVGDVAISDGTYEFKVTKTGPDGKEVKVEEVRSEIKLSREALEVDKEGEAARVRLTILHATHNFSATQPAISRKVEIDDISCVAKSDGRCYIPDTESITNNKTQSLKGAQLGMARDILDDYLIRDRLRATLPAEAVKAGQEWKLTEAQLAALVKDAGMEGGKATSGAFKLKNVKDGKGDWEGTIAFTVKNDQGIEAPTTYGITYTLDLKTGRILRQHAIVERTAIVNGESYKRVSVIDRQKSYHPGNGTADKSPDAKYKLGWKLVTQDDNSYKNPYLGFSLELPPGFEVVSETKHAVEFRSKDKAMIHVSSLTAPFPLGDEADADSFLDGMKKGGATIDEKIPMTLPGNYPGLFIAAHRDYSNSWAMWFADGRREVVAGGWVPKGEDDVAKQVKAALLTLRVFKPDKQAKWSTTAPASAPASGPASEPAAGAASKRVRAGD